MTGLAVTWWGHSSTTVELGGIRVAFDPLLADRLAHLTRSAPTPGASAAEADVVLVSHQHADHLHLPSLRRFAADVPVVGPTGSERLLARSGAREVVVGAPGEVVDVAGLRIEVLAATHAGGRHTFDRSGTPAVGFRVSTAGLSCWYPGDTGLRDDMVDVEAVDLALVPVGGWGPTLPDTHLSPSTGAQATRRVGARYALPVHWGTFWPVGLARVTPERHRRLFVSPGERFAAELGREGDPAPLVVEHCRRMELA